MLITPYVVIDLSSNNDLAVVCEAATRKECEDYIRAKRLAKCDVFKEHGEELYRGICEVVTVETNTQNLKLGGS